VQILNATAPAALPGAACEIRLPISQLPAIGAIVAAAITGAQRPAVPQHAAL